MTAFRTMRRVEFQHCDPAGIVFYPRYFEMINSVIEEWFGDALGLSFAAMHSLERAGGKAGAPTVRIEAEFPAPSRLGDALEFSLSLKLLGETSATTRIEARCGGELRLTARSVLVFVAGVKMRATSWPEAQRARMARYVKSEGEADG